MIKKISIQNYLWGNYHQFFPAYQAPGETGLPAYRCDSVSGLGPVKAEINMAKAGLSPGKIFNSATVNERNIVIHMTAPGGGRKSEERKKMFRAFSPGDRLNIRIDSGEKENGSGIYYETSGYLESMESDFWSLEPTIQLSIICPNPKLHKMTESGSNLGWVIGI